MFLACLSCILPRNSICFVLFCVGWGGGGGSLSLNIFKNKINLIYSIHWPTTSTLLAPGLLGAGHEQCIYMQEGNTYV
jgi:hypothetical protein